MKTQFFGLLIVALFMMISFQNCTVYQSQGRKYIESNGVNSLSSSQQTSGAPSQKMTSLSETSCTPYLENNEARQVLNTQDVSLKLQHDPSNNSLLCTISKQQEPVSDIDFISCSISSENLFKIVQVDPNEKILDPHPNGELSGKSFGYIKNINQVPVLYFMGAIKSAPEAIECKIIFDNKASLENQKVLAVERLSQFTHLLVRMTVVAHK